jgi:NTP pyrophosphatase (non-canonical NTP hydrolase)
VNQVQSDVLQFHIRLGIPIGLNGPAEPDAETIALRRNLVEEEYDELMTAVDVGDLSGIADGAADLIYVAVGLCLAYGIDLRPVWEEVQRANLAKADGPIRADGKRMKPDGWTPPDIDGIIRRQIEAAR